MERLALSKFKRSLPLVCSCHSRIDRMDPIVDLLLVLAAKIIGPTKPLNIGAECVDHIIALMLPMLSEYALSERSLCCLEFVRGSCGERAVSF